MRLNQYLAACGLGSRRRCESIIASGRVRVNGALGHFGMRIGDADRVDVDGQRVQPQTQGGIWALHKPRGVLSTASDPQQRPTVLDLARAAGISVRVFPVGRLDFETTGLLLLTNDGALSHRLTHPSWGVGKEYEALVAAPLSEVELQRLRAGVQLEDGVTAPCAATQEQATGGSRVRIVLHEGRKRQIRRMLTRVGHPVLALHRVRFGPIRLGDLPEGAIRALDEDERRAIIRALDACRPQVETPPASRPVAS